VEQACEGASLWLGVPFPRRRMLELAERANVVYQHNIRFRGLLHKRGDAGNDWVAAFMRSWLSSLLASRRPDLYLRLPGSDAVGRDLPLGKPAPGLGEGRRRAGQSHSKATVNSAPCPTAMRLAP